MIRVRIAPPGNYRDDLALALETAALKYNCFPTELRISGMDVVEDDGIECGVWLVERRGA